jgi:hypothetical protein
MIMNRVNAKAQRRKGAKPKRELGEKAANAGFMALLHIEESKRRLHRYDFKGTRRELGKASNWTGVAGLYYKENQ